MSFTYNPITVSADLATLAKAGTLTEEDLRTAWNAYIADRNFSVDRISRELIPMGLNDLFYHTTVGGEVEKQLRDFNISLRLRLPPVIAWIKQNHEVFAALAMDHNAFLKMALEHSIVGQRVLYEVAESPQLVMSLNKDEGLILLERALKTYGHLVSWSGMGYVSEHWPINQLQEMILRLVEEPEVAGGFLGNEWAHAGGWRLFKSATDFLAVVTKAASFAPFEAWKNRKWIATRLGELLNGDDFMATDSGWSNYDEIYTKKYEPVGAELFKQVASAIDIAYRRGIDDVEAPLSTCSRAIVGMIKAVPAEFTDARQATQMAAALIHLPDMGLGREILERLFTFMETKDAAPIYRLVLSVRQVFWRDLYRVLGHEHGDHWEFQMGEAMVRESWFLAEIKAWMKAKGWRGLAVEKRRNERFLEESDRGWDFEVSCRLEDGRLHIFKLSRRMTWREDSYHQDTIVLLPPNSLELGRIVFQNDHTAIHETGEMLHIDAPATSKMGRW